MNNLFVGLNITDNMFPPNCKAVRQNLNLDEVKTRLKPGGYTFCIPTADRAMSQALQQKYGLEIKEVTVPNISLTEGDSILCVSARGLSPLEGGRTAYSEEEISNADFSFGLWTVQNVGPTS